MNQNGGSLPDRRDLYDPVLHIVLYKPEIPYNAGAAGRTCVAVGAKLWLVRPLGFRIDNRYMRRAGLDYWPHLIWEVADDWDDLIARLPDRRPWFFSKTASRGYTDVAYQRGDVLVFGSESAGLPQAMLEPKLRPRLAHSHPPANKEPQPLGQRGGCGVRGPTPMGKAPRS